MAAVQVNQEEGVLTAVVLEKPPPALTPELEAKQAPTLGAYMTLMGNILRLWNNVKEPLDRVQQMFKERAGAAMTEGYAMRGPARFFDVFSECLIFPRFTTDAEIEPRIRGADGKVLRRNLDSPAPEVPGSGSSHRRRRLDDIT